MRIVYIADVVSYIVSVDCASCETKTEVVLSNIGDERKGIPADA